MKDDDELFIGWQAKAPARDRRFLLGASLALLAGAAATGAGFAGRRPGAGPGRWDQGAIERYSGVLVETPYPTLLTQDAAGARRAMLLVGYDKTALPRVGATPSQIAFDASAIIRGSHRMLAVSDAAGFAKLARTPAGFAPPAEQDLGPALRTGEILDAKCWFGAMNPGVGLTHKACAALCARGGLPLAFCPVGDCETGDDEVCLFLDDTGAPHGADIIPFVADPVLAEGRLVRRNGLLEFRVAAGAIRRV